MLNYIQLELFLIIQSYNFFIYVSKNYTYMVKLLNNYKNGASNHNYFTMQL